MSRASTKRSVRFAVYAIGLAVMAVIASRRTEADRIDVLKLYVPLLLTICGASALWSP